MSLTPEQIAAREGMIGGTCVNILLSGDERKIYNEWLRLIGDPSYEQEDLSEVWPVQFGSYIESFALDWHQRKRGKKLTRRGEVVKHPNKPYVAVTLDAYCADDDSVIDCKAAGSYRKIDDVTAYNTPQLALQRSCVGASCASLLIVHGGAEPVEYPVSWDNTYEQRMWEVIEAFWECVITLTPPNGFVPVSAPTKCEKVYSFEGRNEFASEAVVWIGSYKAAKQAKKAEENLKAMVPPDAAKVTGHNVIITRDRRGYLSLREAKS